MVIVNREKMTEKATLHIAYHGKRLQRGIEYVKNEKGVVEGCVTFHGEPTCYFKWDASAYRLPFVIGDDYKAAKCDELKSAIVAAIPA